MKFVSGFIFSGGASRNEVHMYNDPSYPMAFHNSFYDVLLVIFFFFFSAPFAYSS